MKWRPGSELTDRCSIKELPNYGGLFMCLSRLAGL